MYQRVGAVAYKANLDNINKITEILGKPHLKLKCIHVAGTNGKGSSSHMLAAILQQAGYKTGLYTSPHLIDFRERIKINGKLITKKYIVEFVKKNKQEFESIEPSFFEWTVGLAFDYFVNKKVDIAIIEVGLGGRLDSTNIITPKISLITNISFDHMNLLGDTLEKIASEKAGIIKLNVPLVVSQYQPETAPLFISIAKKLKSQIEFGNINYQVITSKLFKKNLFVTILDLKKQEKIIYQLDLIGNYQLKNLIGVLTTVDYIKKIGFKIDTEIIKKALKKTIKLTGLLGRWQKIGNLPNIIIDVAHNEDGIKQIVQNFKSIKFAQLHIVFGVVNDKDITKIIRLLPSNAKYYFVRADIPRALNENTLYNEAKKIKLIGQKYATVKDGIDAAKKAADKNDLIFIGGSTFVVSDALKLI